MLAPIQPGSAGRVLLIGGARSGKTSRALKIAAPFVDKVYLATAEALDEEMGERIRRHQSERDQSWRTVEAPLELAAAISRIDAAAAERVEHTVVVIDCLTLWLSNLMHHGRDLAGETEKLIAVIQLATISLIFVTNEVGQGIVPENRLARRFRDAQGRLNQEIAAAVDAVELVVAGLPLRLK